MPASRRQFKHSLDERAPELKRWSLARVDQDQLGIVVGGDLDPGFRQ